MQSTVQPDESAARQWCAQIVRRPIAPASPGNLARLYAAHFKRRRQTDAARAVVSKGQP